EGLWDRLLEITLRHCNKWNKRVQREGGKTVPLEPSKGKTDTGFEPADDEPTPEEAAALADLVDGLLSSLDMPFERQILKLRLQGYTVAEISREVSMAERTVARTISEVKACLGKRLEALQGGE